jgi:tetratricopeptide (TPR) repeat protein
VYSRAVLAFVVASAALALVNAASDTVLPPASAAALVDELWPKRDDAAKLDACKKLLDEALVRAPSDYELLWRAARWTFWKSDEPGLGAEEKSKLGKEGWTLAERAVAVNPNHAAGHYWAAVTMGNYALGIGVLRALGEGIEGKFRHHLTEADRFDPKYEHGAVQVAWGGLYAKLPWPKHDEKKATAYFRRALEINPNNLRLRVLWAEVHMDEDRPAEAKRLLEEVMAAPVGKYDAPAEKRAKLLAGKLLRKIEAAK